MSSGLLSRRDALVLGGSAFLSAMLEHTTVASNTPVQQGVDDLRLRFGSDSRKLIWLWPEGAPSQLDSFDMKPDAPTGYHGPFRPVQTQNGLLIADIFPEIARLAHEITWVRSRIGRSFFHDIGIAETLFRQRDGQTLLTRMAEPSRVRPVYGQTPDVSTAFDYRRMAFSGHLCDEIQWSGSRAVAPQLFEMTRNFSRPTHLQAAIRQPGFSSARTQEHDEMTRRAYEVIARGSQIEAPTREDIANYCGDQPDNSIGSGMLTISRLARAGLHKVMIFRFGSWDNHWDLGPEMRRQAPATDRGIAALVRDVVSGRLGNTVLVYGSEFGRHARFTPHMVGTSPGREHSIVSTNFAVASDEHLLRRGLVWGSTDDTGGSVAEHPVTNQDWARTIAEAVAPRPNPAVRRQLPGVFA